MFKPHNARMLIENDIVYVLHVRFRFSPREMESESPEVVQMKF